MVNSRGDKMELDKPHKKLEVWQRSLDLVEEVYRVTAKFPREEKYGLVPQMRRAAISVVSNIAEGAGRKNKKEKKQFFYIARSSLTELETQIEVGLRLGYIKDEIGRKIFRELNICVKLLNGLIRSVK